MVTAFVTLQNVHDDRLIRPAESADGRLRHGVDGWRARVYLTRFSAPAGPALPPPG
jgi:hypothetical protein